MGGLKFSPKMCFFRRTDSPRAKWRVHYAFWKVHWQVLESTFLVRKECPRKLRVPPSISDADRFVVFRGVHPCLHGSAYVLFLINMRKLKQSQSEGPCPRNLQTVCFLFRGIQRTECGIAGGLDPESVNLSWGV